MLDYSYMTMVEQEGDYQVLYRKCADEQLTWRRTFSTLEKHRLRHLVSGSHG
jgi:hypothetical protein